MNWNKHYNFIIDYKDTSGHFFQNFVVSAENHTVAEQLIHEYSVSIGCSEYVIEEIKELEQLHEGIVTYDDKILSISGKAYY